MPHFYRFRPDSAVNEAEHAFARAAQKLPEDWIVIWSYLYDDEVMQTREGDFIIAIPGLGVAVIEVKGYALQRDSRSGDWNTLSHDEPYGQVRAEMKSLLARWSHILPGQTAFFDCFLALPFTPVDTDLDDYRGIPRRHILAANELDQLEAVLREQIGHAHKDSRAACTEVNLRKVFLREGAENHRILHRMEAREIDTLTGSCIQTSVRQLHRNHRFMVEGGPGSGKTFFGLLLAMSWAAEGRKVLLLCYNAGLREDLERRRRDLAAKNRPGAESIQVLNWEELLKLQLGDAFPSVPTDYAARQVFYDQNLPALATAHAAQGRIPRAWDDLIVDEAQDLDTCGHNGESWWPVIFAGLKAMDVARLAILSDVQQRPAFRPGTFDPEVLAASMPTPTWVHLHQSLRYTRAISSYLESLGSTSGSPLPSILQCSPVRVELMAREAILTEAGYQIRQWILQHGIAPHEILVLDQSRRGDRGLLRESGGELAGLPLGDFSPLPGHLRSGSCLKSKGLEATAVLILGLPAQDSPAYAECLEALRTGASRAKQLLAIFNTR